MICLAGDLAAQGFAGGAGVQYLAVFASDDDGVPQIWIPGVRATWLRKHFVLPDVSLGVAINGSDVQYASSDVGGGYRFGSRNVVGFIEAGPTFLVGAGGGGVGAFLGVGAYLRLTDRLALRLDASPRVYSDGFTALGLGVAISSFPRP